MKNLLGGLMGLLALFISCEEAPPPPVAYGPVPSERQMIWQEMEYYAFIHFSMNTFTDIEWGYVFKY
ncbi:hypothetical protein HCG49_13145 [Arenibacter sp. 6A1]|nr:hypothetical protein [Arenibacter sp. 6A1]